MKRLTLIILSIMVLMMPAAMSAQQLTAAEVLAKSTQRVNAAKAIEASFNAITNDGEKSEGELILCREKFKMVTKQYKVWYNGTAMWSYYTRNGEVSLTQPTSDELLEINPFDIINQYDSHYKATLASHQNGVYAINLTPNSHSAAFKSATVNIDQSTWLPESIKAVFSNGSTVDITITSIKELNTVPTTSSFEFPYSQYPSLPVIDLR